MKRKGSIFLAQCCNQEQKKNSENTVFKKNRGNLSDLEGYGKQSTDIFSPHGFKINLINNEIRKSTLRKY